MSLTDVACRNSACPADNARVRLADSGGLYLEVAPNLLAALVLEVLLRWQGEAPRAGALHRGRVRRRSSVSLKAAREARDDARKLLRTGTDPAQKRQLDKLTRQTIAGITFEAVARELHATKHSGWSPRYAARWIERMEKDLFPWIGSLPLQDITAPLLLHTLRRIENRGAHETAHTLRQTAGQVFRYGIATGRCERNPAPDLHGALRAHRREAHGGRPRPGRCERADACHRGLRRPAADAEQRSNYPRCCSSARATSGRWSGPSWTSTVPCGPFRPRR